MLNEKTSRAKSVIDADRIGLVTGSEDLIRRDIEEVFGEYFCVDRGITVKLEPSGDRVFITVIADCSAVKRFNILR